MNDIARPAARLVVLLLTLIFCASPARADELQDIERLLKQGQHAQALERVNRYLLQNPSDAQARFKKGLILAEQNKVAEAIAVFVKLSQDYPKLPEPHNNLAVLYASQGQYEKARQQLEMSIRTDPSYATAYENLGDVYAKLASQAYDKALQLDSSNAGAQNKLSLVRELVGGPSPAAAGPPVIVAQGTAAPAAKRAAEKPAAPKAAPAKPADATSEVLAALNGWAQAWSGKNADAYVSYYAKDFKTPGGESWADWERARRTRIAAPKSISVAIGSPKVTMNGPNQAKVTFRQSYRSDVLKSTSTKTVVMVKNDGRWQIQQERSGS